MGLNPDNNSYSVLLYGGVVYSVLNFILNQCWACSSVGKAYYAMPPMPFVVLGSNPTQPNTVGCEIDFPEFLN